MGKKPVVGLAGLFLAGMALCGCQDTNNNKLLAGRGPAMGSKSATGLNNIGGTTTQPLSLQSNPAYSTTGTPTGRTSSGVTTDPAGRSGPVPSKPGVPDPLPPGSTGSFHSTSGPSSFDSRVPSVAPPTAPSNGPSNFRGPDNGSTGPTSMNTLSDKNTTAKLSSETSPSLTTPVKYDLQPRARPLPGPSSSSQDFGPTFSEGTGSGPSSTTSKRLDMPLPFDPVGNPSGVPIMHSRTGLAAPGSE